MISFGRFVVISVFIGISLSQQRHIFSCFFEFGIVSPIFSVVVSLNIIAVSKRNPLFIIREM